MTKDHNPNVEWDVIVVGAGPAGSSAAISAARLGLSVCLIERGRAPGSKNLFGGVVYPAILSELIPNFLEDAPIERAISRRVTMAIDGNRSTSLVVDNPNWVDEIPNGFTVKRSLFDSWLADQAVKEGATLLNATTVTSLDRSLAKNAKTLVYTDRGDIPLSAKVVIAADGANSFIAKEAGLFSELSSHHYTLGVKRVIELDETTINERFNQPNSFQGTDIEILGCTMGVSGGGFLYTNRSSISIGVVLSLDSFSKSKVRPEEILSGLCNHPSIKDLIKGGTDLEYGAHLIPEAGKKGWPELYSDGLLIAGDSGFMCLAAGIWLEGVNYAIASGDLAGRASAQAIRKGDVTKEGLSIYKRQIDESFVGKNHSRFQSAPELVMSPIVQNKMPKLACDIFDELFKVRDPLPKVGIPKAIFSAIKANKISKKELIQLGIRGFRSFK
ncbi:FAD-dependent oxidoreductase [Acidithrix sp. C25]|uniref:FAD-dependent oxidoreductase n=1 Tax=Acidithrix sp. C25 TaxID=1671482 RepID=UPI00191BC624|nr:FAD-dependent oxidoreductase [Acidithrix sp. C25]CAG4902839.1 unnamed protein product [Acidithrix sp. C25]